MLKKKLSGILAVVIAASAFSATGYAQTEETKLFSDNFESGLNSQVWNVTSQTGLGEVKSDKINWIETSAESDAEFSYEYSAQKEDISLNVLISTERWKVDGAAFEAYIRYVNAENWFKLTYTPSNGKFALVKCVAGTETEIASATKVLDTGKNYKLTFAAKHGIVRFELDGITLIQDYTGIENFDKNADKNSVKFKTLSQKLKVMSLSLNEEDTLLHQNLENSDIVMTDSSNTATSSASQIVLPTNKTVGSEALKLTGKQTLRIKKNDWEYEHLGNDFEATELIVVVKSNEFDGTENLHLRTTVNADGKQMNLVQLKRDGFSIGDNYGVSGKKEAIGENGKYKQYGWRAFDSKLGTADYRTYKVRTEPNADKSKVTVTFTAEGEQWGIWEDTQPIAPEDGRLCAGGFEISTTVDTTIMYIKSYELRDITGNDSLIYEESFANADKWTNAEIASDGGADNKYYVTTASDNGTLVISDKSWKNVIAEANVKFDVIPQATIDNYAGVMARYTDASNYIMGAYSPYAEVDGKGTVFIKSVIGGTKTTVVSKEIAEFAQGSEHKIGINVKDGAAVMFVDGNAVLNAPFKTTGERTYGSVAIKSNNLATKFDNVSVSGSPYYFVEEFNAEADWSAYKAGTKTSSINDKVTFNQDGTITLADGAEIYLYADENNSGDWDDVEMTVKMKTNNREDMSCLYFRGGVDESSANYYVQNAEKSTLGLNAKWGTLLASTSGLVKVPNSEYYEVKLRLTDEKTADNKDAVRIRYTVDGTEQINYLDDGSVAKAVEVEDHAVKNLLNQHPLTAATHGRGFRISLAGAGTITYTIDSITVTDPEAGTVLANVSAPETFAANADIKTKLNVVNKGYEAKEIMFVTAVYNSANELVNVKVSYPSTASDDSDEYENTINTGSATKMKVFAWDGWDSMLPIANPAVSSLAQ